MNNIRYFLIDNNDNVQDVGYSIDIRLVTANTKLVIKCYQPDHSGIILLSRKPTQNQYIALNDENLRTTILLMTA